MERSLGPAYLKYAYDAHTASRLPQDLPAIEAVRRGATHIHAVVVPQAANRDTLEKHYPYSTFQVAGAGMMEGYQAARRTGGNMM